jgi:hypothetical protein
LADELVKRFIAMCSKDDAADPAALADAVQLRAKL